MSTTAPHTLASFTNSKRHRPVPSPLQESTTPRSASEAFSAPRSPPTPITSFAPPPSPSSASPRSPRSGSFYPQASGPTATAGGSSYPVRTPNPAKKAPTSPAIEEFRDVVTRDALREEERKRTAPTTADHSQPVQRHVSAPVLVSAPHMASTSPPSSPSALATMDRSGTGVGPASAASSSSAAAAADYRPMAARTTSIDSTVSAASSTTSLRPNGSSALRVSSDSSGSSPQDMASMIAAAGSAEAALSKLYSEKQQAASHNAQLWRLVEKQRAMILGLNKDLEKTLREKERYRRKLKEGLVSSTSAPALAPSAGALDDEAHDCSPSPALKAEHNGDLARTAVPGSSRDFSIDSRKASDTSDAASPVGLGRSDTPQDGAIRPPVGDPGTPQSASSGQTSGVQSHGINQKRSVVLSEDGKAPALLLPLQACTDTRPLPLRISSDAQSLHHTLQTPTHQRTISMSSAASPPASAKSFSTTPKQVSRKAPPAPLNLSPRPDPQINNNIIDASDSDENEGAQKDLDKARAEHLERGRRKTREEDDQEREEIAQQELEQRSRSTKDTKKSKSRPSAEDNNTFTSIKKNGVAADLPTSMNETFAAAQAANARAQASQMPMMVDGAAEPAAILRQRTRLDAAGLQKSITAPSLLSPGLPMSPRPGDRPLNSPMPRAPTKVLNGLPMSPKAGMMMGLPLSPRAPKHALPLIPQTPLTISSPHLARAEIYAQHAQQQPSISSMLSDPSSDMTGRTSTSSDPRAQMHGGEIYRGFVTEQYPDLLLPPNALASIYVKTSSSRMKPSRHSMMLSPNNKRGGGGSEDDSNNPVITLAVHTRSDGKQLWRTEKTLNALAALDQQIKAVGGGAAAFRERLPDRALFAGHAPAKIDARRAAMDLYFEKLLDAVTVETAAKVVCRFLSTDTLGAEMGVDYLGTSSSSSLSTATTMTSSTTTAVASRSDTPMSKTRPLRDGYLTKRGKNFGGWKARYFVLDGPNLKYFEAPGGAHMGSIKLQSAQIGKQQSPPAAVDKAEDEDNQFRHAFLILEPKRKDSSSLVRHVLCAESDEERDAWVEALLTYVDYKDGDDDDGSLKPTGRGVIPEYATGARSPRLQKSLNDLRHAPAGGAKEALRAYNYNDVVAGSAPIHGPAQHSGTATPSPPPDGAFVFPRPGSSHPQQYSQDAPPTGNPLISGPTNLQVISNAGDWGMGANSMKPPGTPLAKDMQKDKKRSMFAAFRGRSSSDLATPGSNGPTPADSHQAREGVRAVFAVPLADAVDASHPVDAFTELPTVVYRCIEYLGVKNAVAEEGIFRLSGSNTVIKHLRDRFNAEGDVNLLAPPPTNNTSSLSTAEDAGQGYDVHAVASLLKLYLRELPASILTRDLHLEFLKCLDLHGREKLVALNGLVGKLPRENRALLGALSEFLSRIVRNAEVNKMNVRNVGIVFSPTLNVPAPLISSFVEDHAIIFGPALDTDADASSPASSVAEMTTPTQSSTLPTDLRSPRKQMFSDLPTPAYHQTAFQHSFAGANRHNSNHNNNAYLMNNNTSSTNDTGMIPMQPSYAPPPQQLSPPQPLFQMAPQGDGGYGSLNDALRSPTMTTGFGGLMVPGAGARDVKSMRRESAMMPASLSVAGGKKGKGWNEGSSF